MIYLQLLGVFIKIGVLGFGGGYAMLSLIQHEVVDHYAWMSTTDFADMVAISQMTPGPISINLATYVGYTTAGLGGSLLASFALCLPSLIMNNFRMKYSFCSALYNVRYKMSIWTRIHTQGCAFIKHRGSLI